MPYLPNLIPEKDKVIPEYFHKQSTVGAKVKAPVAVGPILLGLLFLFIAIYFIRYAGFAALFGLLALFCTGAGKRWLENAGRFRMTGAARLVIYGIILAVSVPIYLAYQHQDEVDATDRLAEHQRAAKFTADSLRADSERRQQLFGLLDSAKHAAPAKGLRILGRTDGLVKNAEEKGSFKVIYEDLQLQLVQNALDRRNYQDALTAVQILYSGDAGKPKLWFYRARCYIGLDSMQLAVNDLDSARAQNFKPADRLFDQINPLKRHIVGYCTLCNDGSTSDATGRGACSWHGGVAEWNHPIYETSRKYGE